MRTSSCTAHAAALRSGLSLAALVFATGCQATARSPEMPAQPERGDRVRAVDEDDAFLRLDDTPRPPQDHLVPDRPAPLFEWGDPLLAPGPIADGIELPTGAVFQPAITVFGEHRSAVQTFDDGNTVGTEWVNRLDLFTNLQLSGTERLLIGMRPLDRGTDATGVDLDRGVWQEELNARLTHLFFEGDVGELFPRLDPRDQHALDFGFSIGRQPLLLQDGLLLDDTIDSVGITRNTLMSSISANLRLTALYGWNDVHRDDNNEDESAQLLAISGQADMTDTTVSADMVWVADQGDQDAVYFGLGSVQRIGRYNTTVRAVSSHPFQDDSPEVSGGALFFGEISRPLRASDDLVYANAFFGLDRFASAARGPGTGGPLGRTGILFEAVQLGNYGAALGNRADDSMGGALGCQLFFDNTRRQAVIELGGREELQRGRSAAIALGSRLQQAIGQRFVARIDGFVGGRQGSAPSAGLRLEILVKF